MSPLKKLALSAGLLVLAPVWLIIALNLSEPPEMVFPDVPPFFEKLKEREIGKERVLKIVGRPPDNVENVDYLPGSEDWTWHIPNGRMRVRIDESGMLASKEIYPNEDPPPESFAQSARRWLGL